MDLELYMVIAMIIALFVVIMVDQHRKEKRQNAITLSNKSSAKRNNNFEKPTNDYSETKTKELPVFANSYDNF